MRHLSGILLIVFLVAFPACKYFKGGSKAKTMAVSQARQDNNRLADSLRNVQDQLQAIENAKLESARKAEEERLALESQNKYNIIVGSFITPEYAKELAGIYQKKGYNAKIIKMDGSKFELVSAEAHDNFKKAYASLKEFQKSIEFDAWMYIKK